MAKEDPNVEAAGVVNDAANEAPKTVPVEQYDALLRQFQETVNEANRRLAALESEKKLLQDTLATQNKLVDTLFNKPADNK